MGELPMGAMPCEASVVMCEAAKAAAVDTAVAENASTKKAVAWWSVAAGEGM